MCIPEEVSAGRSGSLLKETLREIGRPERAGPPAALSVSFFSGGTSEM